jgi:hypothetical protein
MSQFIDLTRYEFNMSIRRPGVWLAFSLACPLVIPLRICQVLFTGYWFWGKLISPKVFPTISDTQSSGTDRLYRSCIIRDQFLSTLAV